MKVSKIYRPRDVAWPKISWDKVHTQNSFDMKSNIRWFLQWKSQAYSLHTCHDATFGLITIAINLLIHPSHSKFSVMFFTVCLTVLVMVVWRIWYWITSKPLIYIFFYSHHLPAWYSVLLSQSWEFWKGKSLKITVICNLTVASWLLYKIEFHESRKNFMVFLTAVSWKVITVNYKTI